MIRKLPLVRRAAAAVDRLTPSGSVTERTIKSGIWATGLNVADRVLQLLTVLLLARLLLPAEYGRMMFALLILTMIRELTKLGIDEALIYNPDDDVDVYLDTAWTLKLFRGVVVAVVLYLAGPTIASAFGEPSVGPLIQAVGLGPLILGLQTPAAVYFRKDLAFHKQFVYTVSGSVVLAAASVAIAVAYRSAWALVVGTLLGYVTRALVSYLLHDYRPSFKFDYSRAKEMIGYGKWMLGFTLLSIVFNNGDDLFVTWLLSASALGFYQLAYRISNAPATEVSHVVTGVAFSALSKVQDDVHALREGYTKMLQLVTLVSFPVAVGIALVARPFVLTFLGEQWVPIVLPMQILVVYGLLRSFGSTVGPVVQAVGRPDLLTKLLVVKVVFAAAFIYPATEAFGIVGTAVVITVVPFVDIPVGLWLVSREIDTPVRRLLLPAVYPCVGALVMGVTVFGVRELFGFDRGVLPFVALVGVGVVVYVATMLGLERRFSFGLRALVGTIRGSLG